MGTVWEGYLKLVLGLEYTNGAIYSGNAQGWLWGLMKTQKDVPFSCYFVHFET